MRGGWYVEEVEKRRSYIQKYVEKGETRGSTYRAGEAVCREVENGRSYIQKYVERGKNRSCTYRAGEAVQHGGRGAWWRRKMRH